MTRLACFLGLLIALSVCSVAEARVRNVTIVRRQRVVAAVPVPVPVERPLELRSFLVPSQTIILAR